MEAISELITTMCAIHLALGDGNPIECADDIKVQFLNVASRVVNSNPGKFNKQQVGFVNTNKTNMN
jgi:hypothetical protein